MSQSHPTSNRGGSAGQPAPASVTEAKAAEEAQAANESREEPVSKPGGFRNDPDDPTNPNEVIERHRRKLRP